MLINCSSEPQQNIKIRLVVDEKEKLVLTAYGQEVDILREKYADLINLMDEACNSSHLSKEDVYTRSQSRIQYLKTTSDAQKNVQYGIESYSPDEKLIVTAMINVDIPDGAASCLTSRKSDIVKN